MSKLEELLKRECPDGVECKALSELGNFYAGLNGKNKDDFKDGNAKYITYMNVFSNLSVNTNINDTVQIGEKEKQNIVKYGDVIFTGSSETIEECGMSSVVTNELNEKLYLNSFCFGFRFNEPEIMLPDFSKYLFRSTELRKKIIKTASGVTRFNVSKKKMEKILIPIPPIEVQKEIVRILDTFTKYQDLLNRELELRKKQYEYYRDKLLTFAEGTQPCGDKVEWKNIDEIVNILDNLRKPVSKDKRTKGNYPYYGANGIQDYVDNYIFDGTFILMGEDGSVINKDNSPVLNWASGKIWVNNHAHVLFNENINILRFVFYYLQTIDVSSIVRGTPPKINQQNLRSIKIPVPPLEEQERIVNILDKFDALCNDITKGLPAEIEMRKKQYEYYRDKLLTFKEKKK